MRPTDLHPARERALVKLLHDVRLRRFPSSYYISDEERACLETMRELLRQLRLEMPKRYVLLLDHYWFKRPMTPGPIHEAKRTMAWINERMPVELAVVPLFAYDAHYAIETELEFEEHEDVEDSEPSPEEDVWHWLGGYVPKLEPVVDEYLHGATTEKRLHAFNKLNKYRRKKSDGKWQDLKAFSYYDGKSYRSADKNRHSVFGADGVEMSETSVSRKLTGRRDRPRDRAAADATAAREFLKSWAKDKGRTLDGLAAPKSPGRPSQTETARLRMLSDAVRAARAHGFTQQAIGEAIGRDKRRVSELERRAA
jgi:hypothetical protein